MRTFIREDIGSPTAGRVFDDVKVKNMTADGSVREEFNFPGISSELWGQELSKETLEEAIINNFDGWRVTPYIKQLSWASRKCYVSYQYEDGRKSTNNIVLITWEEAVKGEGAGTQAFDDVKVKNLTMDGSVRENFHFTDIQDALWEQKVSKEVIEKIVKEIYSGFAKSRGTTPVVTKFSTSSCKAYIALKRADGSVGKDLILITWTPFEIEGLNESKENHSMRYLKEDAMEDIILNHASWSGDDMCPACRDCANELSSSGYSSADVKNYFDADGYWSEANQSGVWDKDFADGIVSSMKMAESRKRMKEARPQDRNHKTAGALMTNSQGAMDVVVIQDKRNKTLEEASSKFRQLLQKYGFEERAYYFQKEVNVFENTYRIMIPYYITENGRGIYAPEFVICNSEDHGQYAKDFFDNSMLRLLRRFRMKKIIPSYIYTRPYTNTDKGNQEVYNGFGFGLYSMEDINRFAAFLRRLDSVTSNYHETDDMDDTQYYQYRGQLPQAIKGITVTLDGEQAEFNTTVRPYTMDDAIDIPTDSLVLGSFFDMPAVRERDLMEILTALETQGYITTDGEGDLDIIARNVSDEYTDAHSSEESIDPANALAEILQLVVDELKVQGIVQEGSVSLKRDVNPRRAKIIKKNPTKKVVGESRKRK